METRGPWEIGCLGPKPSPYSRGRGEAAPECPRCGSGAAPAEEGSVSYPLDSGFKSHVHQQALPPAASPLGRSPRAALAPAARGRGGRRSAAFPSRGSGAGIDFHGCLEGVIRGEECTRYGAGRARRWGKGRLPVSNGAGAAAFPPAAGIETPEPRHGNHPKSGIWRNSAFGQGRRSRRGDGAWMQPGSSLPGLSEPAEPALALRSLRLSPSFPGRGSVHGAAIHPWSRQQPPLACFPHGSPQAPGGAKGRDENRALIRQISPSP